MLYIFVPIGCELVLDCVYLDNSATTFPCDEAIKSIKCSLESSWGNPSSTHQKGIEAFLELANAKEVISASIGCKPDELIFTSGGTEANNLAIIGAVLAAKRGLRRIISTTIEHPSVLKTLDYLESLGFEIIKLSPDTNGHISLESLSEAIDDKTALVTIMMVNNEIGTVQNISEISKLVKKNNCDTLIHCDAVQGYGKLPIKVSSLGVDLLSASGHKIHASKGIGFLYKKKNVRISPIIHGGGQEFGLRSGTEPMPLICGLASAVKALPNLNSQYNEIANLRNYAVDRLSETNLVEINSPSDALPFILNFSVTGYKAEPLLNALSMRNIFVSKGSACAKGQRSYVLSSLGFDNDRIDSSLRISFSRYNSKQDVDVFVDALIEITKTLRRFK